MGWMQAHGCREAARLMSQQRDEALGPWQRLRLQWHLRRCGNCREVERQLAQIDGLARQWLGAEAGPDEPAQR